MLKQPHLFFGKRVFVSSNTQSSLCTLMSHALTSPSVTDIDWMDTLHQYLDIVCLLGCEIELYYMIPGHVGLFSNELADTTVKHYTTAFNFLQQALVPIDLPSF